MPSSTDITLLASAARAASGTGASVDLGIKTGLLLTLAVSAVSGTSPTLQVKIETSADGSTWRLLDTFAVTTAVGPVVRAFAGADRYVRAAWTIGGTAPSFTFGLAGQALLLYATPTDVSTYGVAAEALASISHEKLARHLIAWTGWVDDQIGAKRFKLPLVKWSVSLTMLLSEIVAWTALSNRGVTPQTGDKDIEARHNKARASVIDIAESRAGSSDEYVDSTPEVHDPGPYTFSRARRR